LNPGLSQVAQVIGVHGIKGELKCRPLTTEEDIFQRVNQVWLGTEDAPRAILASRMHQANWLLLLEGIQTRTDAEAVKGKGIFLPEEMLRPLGEDEFFIHSLLGCQVKDLHGHELGKVVGYMENGPQVLFEVQGQGHSFFFPAVKEILQVVDEKSGWVVIDPPPGLVDLNQGSMEEGP